MAKIPLRLAFLVQNHPTKSNKELKIVKTKARNHDVKIQKLGRLVYDQL